MSVIVNESQTPLLETPQLLVDESFDQIASVLGVITLKPQNELTIAEQDDLRIARRMRVKSMFEKHGDDEYRSFKPVHM